MASRSQEEAVAAVPDEYLEQGALIGSVDRIRKRWDRRVIANGLTGVIVGCDTLDEIDLIADLAGTRDEVGAQP